MNIVLLNQFFPPAQAPTGILLGDLASELVRRGHEVTVIASAAGYGAEGGALPAGVRILRTGPGEKHRSGPAAKLRDYLAFYRGARRKLARMPVQPDLLVCMTTPPFIGLLGARLRKRQGIPYVLWCMDLYPEALAANGWLRNGHPLNFLLRRLAHAERRAAAVTVALGADMADRLRASGAARVETVPVWSGLQAGAAELAAARELRRARGWAPDETVLLYSGNMGRAHSAEEFAALAERLAGNRACVRFVFAGEGPQRADWQRRWGHLFEFLPAASADACAGHLLAADIHLVSQRPEWAGVVVPSKFQAACALGRPVVFAGPPQSAVGQWITQADAGWILPPGDAAALDAAVREVADIQLRTAKGVGAAQLHRECFTPAATCGKVSALVEAVAKRPT